MINQEEAVAPKLIPLKDLSPAPWNPRSIKSERMRNLMRSLQADPDMLRLRPILAQGNGVIYAGNQRYLAVRELGWERVWAIIQDVPEQLAKERALKDNNEWGIYDDQKLRDMVLDLRQQGSDLDLLGFLDKELKDLTGGRGMPQPGDQATDEPEHLFGVVITCKDEDEQIDLLERLSQEGYDVKALVS